jgi:glutamate transport system permease protein
MLSGLWDTVRAADLAVLLAIGVGLLFGAGKLSDHVFVRAPAWIFVEFFRAVPLLMVIIALFGIYGRDLTPFWCLVIGLTLYNGAVLAEVFRAGVNAVPRGQAEAAYAIGMRKTQVMTIVLLPQAIKIMIPAIISQCVVVLKDTSLGFYILAPDSRPLAGTSGTPSTTSSRPALVLAATYIVLNSICPGSPPRHSGGSPATGPAWPFWPVRWTRAHVGGDTGQRGRARHRRQPPESTSPTSG